MVSEIYNKQTTPELTVALPVYNSKKIAWIALESLCNQIDIDFDWELIIYEEIHEESVFPYILNDYTDRLKNIGCSRIVLISGNERVLLVDKWITIAKNTSPTSEAFLLHAADCHSPSSRLITSYRKIVKEGYDWYDQTMGYFYSFISDRIILYDYKGLTNLNMCLKTSYMKTLPKTNLKRGIDGYIYNHCLKICGITNRKLKHYYDTNLYNDSIDTHGFNNISVDREKFFTSKPNIFTVTDYKLIDLGINHHVIHNINKMEKYKNILKKVDNKNFDLSIIISVYGNLNMFEECIESIKKSIKDYNVEVLIGVDSCVMTYDYVKKTEFPANFKFYFFEKNVGPYIVFNTLSNFSDSHNLLFFGADDIMSENMVYNIVKNLNSFECVKAKYSNFQDGEPLDNKSKKISEGGVFGIRKEKFDYLNGFEPWICEADSEFVQRMYKNNFSIKISDTLDFHRRIHNNSLTTNKETGYNSKLRDNYKTIYKNKTNFGPLPKKVTEKCYLFKESNKIYSKKTIVEKKQSAISNLFSRTTVSKNVSEEKKVTKSEKIVSSQNSNTIKNLPNQKPKPNHLQDRGKINY